jgi:hypothetical protein
MVEIVKFIEVVLSLGDLFPPPPVVLSTEKGQQDGHGQTPNAKWFLVASIHVHNI